MALKAILDSIDDLPDPLKSEYIERDGKFELQVEGMKTEADVTRVTTSLNKERSDFKAFKARYAPLADRKVEDVVAALDRIPELEAAAEGKLDDAKIEKIVEGRVKAKLGPIERERDGFKAQLADKDKLIENYTAKERRSAIHDAVRKAATAAKVLPEAIEDALNLADRVFELDESGKVVVKEGAAYMQGIEPAAWFVDIQKSRGHWWGLSAGGGAGGNRGGGGAAVNNPYSHEHWNMTEQGKLFKADRAKADQLAKLAGHPDAAHVTKRPAPKK